MEKSEYYSRVIKVVTELTEVSEEEILGKSKRQEVVDARWLVICLLKESGWSTHRIAESIGHPVRMVNNALSGMTERARYAPELGNNLAIARQQLR